MAKQIIIRGGSARLKRGVDALADAVKTTLGPKGRNVALDKKFGAPTVTHDGVTVAKEIELEDPFENMGAQLLKEAATKTNDVAGDGTTTATVLAQAIVTEGLQERRRRRQPDAAQARHRQGREALSSRHQGAWPTPVHGRDEIAQVAAISAADSEIGDLIAEVMEKVGKDGVITVEESKGLAVRDRVHRGHADRPRLHLAPTSSPTPSAWKPSSTSPYILITDKKISAHRGHPAGAGEGCCRSTQEPRHHRRGRRRRGAGDAGGQQAARHDQRAGDQGARLRRPPQGDAARTSPS